MNLSCNGLSAFGVVNLDGSGQDGFIQSENENPGNWLGYGLTWSPDNSTVVIGAAAFPPIARYQESAAQAKEGYSQWTRQSVELPKDTGIFAPAWASGS